MTNIINVAPPEQTQPILDPKHPGINDKAYVKRRTELFNLGLEYRLHQSGFPAVTYDEGEQTVWQIVSKHLAVAHEARACTIYLEGKKRLHIDAKRIPDLLKLNKNLEYWSGFKLIPAEGLLEPLLFFTYLSQRAMPCTQYIRYASNPEYTPEPDAVHDIIGHIPQLMDQEYTDLISRIGYGVRIASEEQLKAWTRFYWFTIEFGLIEEGQELKAFGAGLLSSYAELEHAFSDQVDRRPFSLKDIVNTDYDPSLLQDILYVIPSMKVLNEAIEELIEGVPS